MIPLRETTEPVPSVEQAQRVVRRCGDCGVELSPADALYGTCSGCRERISGGWRL